MRYWVYLISILLVLGLISCHDKVVCPAYQSTYLLDPIQRDQFFSMFEGDSIPKRGRWKVRRESNGTITLIAYTSKGKQLRTIKMQNVLPLEMLEEKDTVLLANIDPSLSSDSLSLGLDSASLFATRNKKGIKYNYDQLWYEENIEELTTEDGVDPTTIFSKKKPKPVEAAVTDELTESELETEDPNDFELESFDENANDSTTSDELLPELEIDTNEPPVEEESNEDDGTDDF